MNPPLTAFPALQTDRLAIRPLRPEDAGALQALTDDPAITGIIHFLPSPFTAADAAALIGRNDDENCFLGVWRDAELIGVVGTHGHGDGTLEIGYWIGPRFQRQGYASEAASGVIAELRRLYPQRQVTAQCLLSNEPSWQLLHKLGFRPAGEQGHRPRRELLVLQDAS